MNFHKVIILFLSTAILPRLSFSQSSSNSGSNNLQDCQTTIFNSDNIKNDTSKICIENRGIADTTECAIYGYAIDDRTLKPIENAIITLVKEPDEIKGETRTDKNGKFELRIFGFIKNHGVLTVSHPKYKCLVVYHFQFESTGDNIEIKFKLKKI